MSPKKSGDSNKFIAQTRRSQQEREKGYRNLALAVAGGAGLGVLSTLASHFGDLLTVGLSPAETIFLVLATF